MAAEQRPTQGVPGLEWGSAILREALQILHSWACAGMASVDGKEVSAPPPASHQAPLPFPFPPSSLFSTPSSPWPPVCQPSAECTFFLFLHEPLSVVLSHYVSDSFPSGQFLSSVLVAGWIFNLLLVIAARTSEMSLFCLCTWSIVSVGIKFQVEDHLPPEHSIIFSFPKFLLGKPKPFEFWFFRCCLPIPLPGTS